MGGRTVDAGCVVIVNFSKVDLDSYRADHYIDSILYVFETLLLHNPVDRWVVIADLASVTTSTPAKALSS